MGTGEGALDVGDRGDDAVRVLSVDDNLDILELTAEFLERQDDRFEVVTATSGREALDVLESTSVDCVVSDYEMPEMDGLEFLDAVRREHPDLPFVLFTGRGSEEIASRAISAGVTDYLQKEIGSDQYAVLANRVANAVDQYRSRHTLEDTRDRFRTLVEEATDAIFVVDESGTFQYVTPAIERVLGYAPEELIGEVGFERVHPDDVERAMERFGELVANPDEMLSVEFRYRNADGDWTWIEARGRNLLEESIGGVVVYAREIGARKEQQRRLETLVSNLPGVVYRCTDEPGWPMEFVRGECRELTGYPSTAIESSEISLEDDLIHADDREMVRETVRDALDERETFEITYRIETRDGNRKWVWERGRGLWSTEGDLQALEGFVSDITERVEYAHELEERERKFRAVFEEAFDAIVVADDDGAVVDANPAATDLFRSPREELLGRGLGTFLSREGVDEPWEQFVQSGTDRGVVTLERPDGTRRTVEYAATADIVPGRHLSILRDVTDRRRRERQLRRQATQFEGFGSVVAHDLRTPLNTAQGRLELARETGEGAHFDTAERALTRLADLVDDLASVMREGELVTDLDPVELERCVESVWDALDPMDANLVVSDAPAIHADEAAVKRLLENLLKNALDHAGGDVTVTVGALSDGFYLADDGPGIPLDRRESVFEPGRGSERGTGFGLVSVQQIALAHGWAIDVTESADGGARFEVTDVDLV